MNSKKLYDEIETINEVLKIKFGEDIAYVIMNYYDWASGRKYELQNTISIFNTNNFNEYSIIKIKLCVYRNSTFHYNYIEELSNTRCNKMVTKNENFTGNWNILRDNLILQGMYDNRYKLFTFTKQNLFEWRYS